MCLALVFPLAFHYTHSFSSPLLGRACFATYRHADEPVTFRLLRSANESSEEVAFMRYAAPSIRSSGTQKSSGPEGLTYGYSWAECDAIVRTEAKRQRRPCIKPRESKTYNVSQPKGKEGSRIRHIQITFSR